MNNPSKNRITLFTEDAEKAGCYKMIHDSGLELFLSSTGFPSLKSKNVFTGGFFEAPASTRYHGCYNGGLFDHSRNVYLRLLDLTEKNKLTWSRPESVFLVAYFHDLCKCDQYVFLESEGMWQYNKDIISKGHGEKSVSILLKYIDLTPEERMCIRYHMGAYETDDWKAIDEAIKYTPNVLWTHWADMLASKIDENEMPGISIKL